METSSNNAGEWIDARAAMALLGYSDPSSVSKLANRRKVSFVDLGSNIGYLWNKAELLAAYGTRDEARVGAKYFPSLARYDQSFKVEGDAMVIADAHCPFVDWEFLDQALRVKDKEKIGQLILAGDTLDCAAFSKFPRLVAVPWAVEKESARAFLSKVCQEFDRVWVLTANHELRYLFKLCAPGGADLAEEEGGGTLDIWETLMAKMDVEYGQKAKFSIYPHCTVNDQWMITHPAAARKQPLSLARELYAIYNKSIVVTHAHMSAWSYAPNGKHELLDCGCFSDPAMFDYKNLRVTAHYQWSESFAILRGERASLYRKDGAQVPAIH